MIAEAAVDRLQERIDALFEKDYRMTFYERIEALMDGERLFRDDPFPVRYGKILRHTLDSMTVVIYPRERIVGAVKEIIPSEEQVRYVNELTDRWWNRAPEEIQKDIPCFYSYNWLRRRAPFFHSFGHLGFEWERMLSLGLRGYKRKAEERLRSPDVAADQEKKDFLRGVLICYDALSDFMKRYAEEAGERAEATENPEERAQYEATRDTCNRLSEEPPQSFHEALQFLWLIVMPLMKVAGCGVFDLGRMDQYLLPYYEADVQSGKLSRDEAHDLLVEFFFKNNEIMSPVDHMSLEQPGTDFTLEMTFDDPNYIIVGGKLENGEPGVNDLSFLFVEAHHTLGLRNPFMVVRYYSGIDEDFWEKTCAAMRDNADIVLYNDNTVVPALTRYGVREEDAVNYGYYGCNDPDVTGKQGGLRQFWINLVLPLDLTLRPDKQDPNYSPEEPPEESQFTLEERMIGLLRSNYRGAVTRPLDEIGSIDELLEEYRMQLRLLLGDYRKAINKDIELEQRTYAGKMRIEDCFLEGPVDRACTWNNGGSIYNVITVQGSGIATVIDSFAAIEKLVFREGRYTLPELSNILSENFRGHEDLREELRYTFPKFGNDIPWVDEIGRMVVEVFSDEVQRQNDPSYLYRFFPTLSTDRDFTVMGEIIGATPDGRYEYEQISENQSPSPGAEQNGLTAVLNSVSTLPFDRITGGPLNLRIHPSAIEGRDGLKALSALLSTYMDEGGMQAQINAVSREQLEEAQRNPDKYRTLSVRVTGYSAYFVQMGKKAQDEIINRTEYR